MGALFVVRNMRRYGKCEILVMSCELCVFSLCFFYTASHQCCVVTKFVAILLSIERFLISSGYLVLHSLTLFGLHF